MWRVALLALAGIGAALAVVVWWEPRPAAGPPAGTTDAIPSRPAGAAPDSARLEKVESALRAETERRQALEERVTELDAAVAKLRGAASSVAADSGPDATPDAGEGVGSGAPPAAFRNRFRPQAETAEERIDKLVAAGFSAERAAYIEQRRSELALQALEQQYTARRDGQPVPSGPNAGETTLRAELGDDDYARYLAAEGRPTTVGVFNVLAGSPAAQAGLQAGDEVTSYGGKRVFDVRDLNQLTLQGTPGESVVVDVLRNGQPMQVVIPRGPLGIGGGGFFRRRP